MTLSKDHDLHFGHGQQLCEISLRSDMGGNKLWPAQDVDRRTDKPTGEQIARQRGGDLTQSYDKSPYTHGNVKRAVTIQTTRLKSSIKQRLRTDLGRSVGVTTTTQLVWLTWLEGPTFPLTATAV